jgi:hypothetical protein
MDWLAAQFGMPVWRLSDAIEPTDQFFPDAYDHTEAAVQRMLRRICRFMNVSPDRVTLRLYTEERGISAHLPGDQRSSGSAGRYISGERETIAVETSNLADPMSVAATIAHELSHVRLLGERRLTGDEEDHEPVTDLATVFFGMGIFTANSTFRYSQWTQGQMQGWKAAKQGYLDERTLGYALGLWAHVRQETAPRWMRHLNANPKSYMSETLRLLKANPRAKA